MTQVLLFTDVNGSIGFGRYAGTYRIATELRLMGFTVQTIDFSMSFTVDEISKIIDRYVSKETIFVGISSTFLITPSNRNQHRLKISKLGETSTSVGWSVEAFENMVAQIKRNSSATKIIVGGAKVNRDLEKVDIWIDGEGELPLRRLLNMPEIFQFNSSQIICDDSDHVFRQEHLPIEIARGCIFKCSFCSYALNGKAANDYIKNTDVVKEELLDNYARFRTTGYMFADDTYNDSPAKIENYHKMITSLPFELDFSAYMRLDLIAAKPHTIPLLYESGARSVFFGIETFNQTAGKNIGKGMAPNRLKDTLYKLKEEWPDTVISAGFIVGLPHESISDIEKTIEWLQEDDCPIDAPSMSVLSVGHKSDIGKNPMTYGIELVEGGWKSEWMNRDDAVELVNTTNFSNEKTFTFYNRMKNLKIAPYDQLFKQYKEKVI